MSLRTNLTERQLAVSFDVAQYQVDRVLRDLLGTAPSDQRELCIVDGTLIPTRDHNRTALRKNYRRSTNVQVVVRRRDRRVAAVGQAWPGNRNDSVVVRATIGYEVTKHHRLIGDDGYQDVLGVTSPARSRRADRAR